MNSLYFKLYEGGGAGLSNTMLSAQCGTVMSYLMGRKLILISLQPLLFSTKQLRFKDLVEPSENISYIFNENITHYSLMNFNNLTCFYQESNHLPDEDFLNGRSGSPLSSEPNNTLYYAVMGKETLSYYSYKFFLEDKEKVNFFLSNNLRYKKEYHQMAEEILQTIDIPNSIHLRRNDFLTQMENLVPHQKDIENILYHNFQYEPILVHTDSHNLEFCQWIPNPIVFVDEEIKNKFPTLDPVEVGLVSQLVAIKNYNFVGNYGSTFTGYIHQQKALNGDMRMRFFSNDHILLDNEGKAILYNRGKYTWNNIQSVGMDPHWHREWPECVCFRENSPIEQWLKQGSH